MGSNRRPAGGDLQAGGRVKFGFVRSTWFRIAVIVAIGAITGFMLWWRGPDWNAIPDAFQAVRWEWVAAAVALNLLSIVARSIAWQIVINQAMPPPRPRFPLVFSAFCVGLLANAVLPGRIGELARVAVLDPEDAAAERALGDARRHRFRAPRLRHRPRASPHCLCARDGRHPRLGADEPDRGRLGRLRCLSARLHERTAASPVRCSRKRERSSAS